MRQAMVGAGILVFACGAAFGQASATTQFEVATVKPTAPSPDGRIRIMMRGGPGTNDPSRVTYEGITLKNLVSTAFGVKAFQITGPGWLDTERFDIVAKVPEGSSKEQFNLMLQNLLAERFKLTLHREKKELPLYELSVGKNGSKLKPAVEDPGADLGPPGLGPQGPPPPGKDGLPQLPPGRPNMAMMFGRSSARLVARVQPVARLVDMLGNSLGSVVVDKTGLSGTYDYTLEFAPEGVAGPLGALPPPPPAPGGDAGPPALGAAGAPSEYPNIFTAVQEQLGLRLDKRSGSVDILVIDHAEKTPTEN